jgi:hypothetical protein
MFVCHFCGVIADEVVDNAGQPIEANDAGMWIGAHELQGDCCLSYALRMRLEFSGGHR